LNLTRTPFASPVDKVAVMSATISAVLDSEIIRDFLAKPRKEHTEEETCRTCQLKGELVLCDNCPAGYHQQCVKIDVVKEHLDTGL
jgi:hypothetical protein